MTAAELFRFNLERLIRSSNSLPLTVALTAWPLPDGLDPAALYRETDNRRQDLRRLRNKSRRGVPFSDLDALARALGVPVSEFFREAPGFNDSCQNSTSKQCTTTKSSN